MSAGTSRSRDVIAVTRTIWARRSIEASKMKASELDQPILSRRPPHLAQNFRACALRSPHCRHRTARRLLAFNGGDLRSQPLAKGQACPRALLERFGCPAGLLSEPFEDGLALLQVAEKRSRPAVTRAALGHAVTAPPAPRVTSDTLIALA